MFAPVVTFRPLESLRTTEPRSLAEGGHGEPVVPPEDLRWWLSLEGVADERLQELPSRHWAFQVTLAGPDGSRPPARPRFESAVLVDDEGQTFPATGVQVPDAAGPARWVVWFGVPTHYRFETITTATVHWELETAGAAMPISTRFRQ